MTFKVLAAVLAICVAQNAVCAGSLYSKKTHQDDKRVVATTYGYWGCVTHLQGAYNVIQEVRSVLQDYSKLRDQFRELRENCDKLPDESDRHNCLQNVNHHLKKDWEVFLSQLQGCVPKIWNITLKFKECLFD